MILNRKLVDAGCERTILGLVLAMLVFTPLAFGGVPPWAVAVVQGLVALALLFWGIRCWVSPKAQLLWPLLSWPVLAFTILALGRYLSVDIEYVARLEMIQVLILASLFFLTVNNLYRQDWMQMISATLIILTTCISSYAIIQWITHSNLVWHSVSPYPGRASGTYISPNNLACLIEMILPLAMGFLLAGRMAVILRILLGYAVLVMLLGLGVTFSRGGWAAALVGLLGVFILLATHRNHRWRALGLMLVVMVIVSVFGTRYLSKSEGYQVHIRNLEAAKTLDLDIRLQLWQAAEQMWRDHFWWGVGPGLFDFRFREYRPEVVQSRPDRAHNDYLNLLTDWGVVGGAVVFAGLVLFIWGLAVTWRHVRRSESDFRSGQSNRFAFFVGAIGAFLALAVHSLVDFNLHIPANAVVAVVLLGLLASNVRFATERYWFGLKFPILCVISVFLVAGVIYLSLQTRQRLSENRWLAQAGQINDPFSPEYIDALGKAYAVDRKNFNTTYLLGEAYRLQCFQGGQDYAAQAGLAMQWFSLGMKLNPYDAYNYLRMGMCLDQLDRHDEAEKQMHQAELLDPNGYYVVANIGWHYVQAGDYAAARQYLIRSAHLQGLGNDIANNYLPIVESRLMDKASSTNALPFGF
jgi:O-antigen ligase